jgi:hypothetical protein
VWAAVALLLAVVIGLARWFGPEKPVEPKPSEVKYAQYQDPRLAPADFGPSGSGGDSAARKQDQKEAEGKWIAAGETDPIKLVGTVTDADTGEPVLDARLVIRRQCTREEQLAIYETQEKAEEASKAAQQGDKDPAEPSETDKVWEELKDTYQTERRTKTDVHGHYRLGVRTPGQHTMFVLHPEYLLYQDEQFVLVEGETERRIDIKLKRGATISGRVTERGTGKGAAGVRVCVLVQSLDPELNMTPPDIGTLVMLSSADLPEGYGETATTDAKGDYTVSGLNPGEATVLINIGDAPYRFSGLPPMRTVSITQPAQVIRNVNFVLDVAGVVWGYVFDETGKPVSGADVVQCFSDSVIAQVAEAATNLRPPIHDSTDRDGLYRLFGPPLNRECRVFVVGKDYSPQISDPFVLTPTNREARVDVYLSSGTTVYGRVLNRRDNSPIAKAQINCMPAVSRLLSPFNAALGFNEVKSGADGSFVVPHLPVGEHKLFTMAEGFKLTLQGEPFFCDGSQDLRLDVFLDPIDAGEHQVYGVVTNESGQPVAGARIGLVSMGLEGFMGAVGGRDAVTDAKGNYLFERVEEGDLMLLADADGYSPTQVKDVQIDAPTDIELETASRINGRVIIRNTGLPPAACGVRAHPTSTPEGDLLSSLQSIGGFGAQCTNGEFSLEVPKGEYMLIANPQGASPGRAQVSVDAGETVNGVVIEVTIEGGSVAGRVVLRNGQSPAGASVRLGREGGSFAPPMPMMENLEFRTMQVGDDGAFKFDRLAGGTYRVIAQLEGYAEGNSGPVELRDGQSKGGVEVVLGSGGGLQGNVVIDGEVAPGAIVTVTGAGFNRVVRADRNGQYVFENLPPGEYLAAAISPDQVTAGRYLPSHGRVVIQDGRVTYYNFGDPQGATVEGLCTPPPPLGRMGFAVLRIAGTGEEVSELNFRNLTSMLTGDMSSLSSIVGLAQIDRDGWFQIENAPEGSYSLDVYYLTMSNLVNSNAQRVYSTMLNIVGEDTVSLQIAATQ